MYMDEKELQAWRYHNNQLQFEYNKLCSASSQREKDSALKGIQIALEWPLFTDYVYMNSQASPFNIAKYGINSEIERCIREIDEVANEERKYDC